MLGPDPKVVVAGSMGHAPSVRGISHLCLTVCCCRAPADLAPSNMSSLCPKTFLPLASVHLKVWVQTSEGQELGLNV